FQDRDLGGPAALRYLQGLPFVDKANIGLEGHSMGGVPVATAAASQPDGYKAMVLEGSTPGSLVATSPKLAKAFGQPQAGENGPVLAGKIYGSVADGSARVLENPPVTHP